VPAPAPEDSDGVDAVAVPVTDDGLVTAPAEADQAHRTALAVAQPEGAGREEPQAAVPVPVEVARDGGPAGDVLAVAAARSGVERVAQEPRVAAAHADAVVPQTGRRRGQGGDGG
jgi:hypothetical protein